MLDERFYWNSLGQLDSVSSNGSTVAQFGYDALGWRARETTSIRILYSVYDDDNVLFEAGASRREIERRAGEDLRDRGFGLRQLVDRITSDDGINAGVVRAPGCGAPGAILLCSAIPPLAALIVEFATPGRVNLTTTGPSQVDRRIRHTWSRQLDNDRPQPG